MKITHGFFKFWWRFVWLVMFCGWRRFVAGDVLWLVTFCGWWRFVGWRFVRWCFVRWRFVVVTFCCRWRFVRWLFVGSPKFYSSFSLKSKQLREAELFLSKENHCFVKFLKLGLIWKATSFRPPMCLVSWMIIESMGTAQTWAILYCKTSWCVLYKRRKWCISSPAFPWLLFTAKTNVKIMIYYSFLWSKCNTEGRKDKQLGNAPSLTLICFTACRK